jgi:ABC-type Fe3+/spermidine/putrescine transport system ATPase subunit
MKVFDNVAYALRVRHFPKEEIRQRVERALEIINLAGYSERYPAELSGGEQQRVALARSLVYEPKVLLLDEPLSNLDAKIREKTRIELRNLLKRVGISSIYVTHDQEEAFVLSDRIVIMNHGKIVQSGEPSEVYRHPSSEFVASFIGRSNILKGKVVADQNGTYEVLILGQLRIRCNCSTRIPVGDECKVIIRSNEFDLIDKMPASGNAMPCEIQAREYKGAVSDYIVKAGNETLVITINNGLYSEPENSFVAKSAFLKLNDGSAIMISKD